MAKRTITISSLSEAAVDQAIKELEAYKKSIKERTEKLIEVMCQFGEYYAVTHVEHIDTGETISSIHGYRKGNKGYIVAGGNAEWIEFGTGVRHNGAAGTSPHPPSSDPKYASYTIGTYGKGNGANQDGWYYYDADGRRKHTYGIEANMFMYKTARELERQFPDLARGVFAGEYHT